MKLLNELDQLEENVLPILKEELKKRGEDEALEKINNFEHLKSEKVDPNSFESLEQEFRIRAESDEPAESIKADFEERGIDFRDFIIELNKDKIGDDINNHDLIKSNYTYEISRSDITEEQKLKFLKEKRFSEASAHEILEKSKNEKKSIKINTIKKLKRKKSLSLIAGIILFVGGGISIVATLSNGSGIMFYGAAVGGFGLLLNSVKIQKMIDDINKED